MDFCVYELVAILPYSGILQLPFKWIISQLINQSSIHLNCSKRGPHLLSQEHVSSFTSAISSERCCVREEALRINWDASHPLGSVGGCNAMEGQSSNMQSGLLKGRFSLNCSSSAVTRRWKVGGGVGGDVMMPQLHIVFTLSQGWLTDFLLMKLQDLTIRVNRHGCGRFLYLH